VSVLKCILVQKAGFFKNINQDSCTVTKWKSWKSNLGFG